MIIKSKFDHFIFLYKIKEKMIYAINKIPWGIPKSLTTQSLFNKYLRGTPIKSKIIYQVRKMCPESRDDFRKDARGKSVKENRKLGI